MEEMFYISAAMPGRDRVLGSVPEHNDLSHDLMIGEDSSMEVSSSVNVRSNFVSHNARRDGVSTILEMESIVEEMIGVNEADPGSSGLSDHRNSTRNVCENIAADSNLANLDKVKGKVPVQIENRGPLFTGRVNNA